MSQTIVDITPYRIKKYDSYSRQAGSLRPVHRTIQKQKSVAATLHRTVPATRESPKSILHNQQGSISGFLENKTIQRKPMRPKYSVPAAEPTNAVASEPKHSEHVKDNAQTETNKSRNVYQKAFYISGMAVFALAMLASVQTFLQNKNTNDVVEVLAAQSTSTTDNEGVSQGTGNEPSNEEPNTNALANYQVAPNEPRYIRIASQSTSARVKNLGNTPENAVDAPANVYDAGWYRDSVLPGSNTGVSLVLGHISGWSTPGVFKNINKLQPGEIIEIEKGDGTILKYSVDKSEEYSVSSIDMAKILYEVPTGTHSLRLMTCGGTFNPEDDSYDSRTVVYASPV
jgi:hypothetical protein